MSILKKLTRSVQKIQKSQKQLSKWLAFAEAIRPVVKFSQLPTPMAPDYSDLKNWAAHPELNDKSSFTPKEISPSQTAPEADVFYLHPTTFFGKNSWNAPLEHARSREFVDEMVIPGQTTVFNQHCRIFAPRYRQATFFSFLEGGKNAEAAFELAFSDILRAFDLYLEKENKGRPFFIAGHSQGTLHGIRLLEERIENSPIFNQFVAAYLVGFRFPKDKFDSTFKQIKPGIHPKQTGCILAWDTYLEKGKPSRRLENRMHYYPTEDGKGRWEKCRSKNPFGVNPLSWTVDSQQVPASQNLGAVHTEYKGIRPALDEMHGDTAVHSNCIGLSEVYPNEVSATLKKDGFLYISKPLHRIFRTVLLPRGNYHFYDIALFYRNIQKNIEERLATFLDKNPPTIY